MEKNLNVTTENESTQNVKVSSAPPTYYDLEKKKKKKELSFEDKVQKFMHESKQIQFSLKRRIEVKLAGGKKKYAKRHRKTK